MKNKNGAKEIWNDIINISLTSLEISKEDKIYKKPIVKLEKRLSRENFVGEGINVHKKQVSDNKYTFLLFGGSNKRKRKKVDYVKLNSGGYDPSDGSNHSEQTSLSDDSEWDLKSHESSRRKRHKKRKYIRRSGYKTKTHKKTQQKDWV